MHDGLHVGARTINLAMDEALQIHAPPGCIERRTVQVKGDDIFGADQPWRHVACEQEVLRRGVVTHAHVPESVDDSLPVQDAVGDDELVDEARIGSRRHDQLESDRCNFP